MALFWLLPKTTGLDHSEFDIIPTRWAQKTSYKWSYSRPPNKMAENKIAKWGGFSPKKNNSSFLKILKVFLEATFQLDGSSDIFSQCRDHLPRFGILENTSQKFGNEQFFMIAPYSTDRSQYLRVSWIPNTTYQKGNSVGGYEG